MKTTIFRGLVIWMLAAVPLFTSCSKDNSNNEQEQKYDNLKVSVDKTLKVGLGDTATFTIEAGSGEYTITNSNERVAKVTLSEKTVSVQALTIGETKVVITDTKSKQTTELTITVTNLHNIAPNEPVYIRLTTQKAIGETIELGIDAEKDDLTKIWLDLNNNGMRDSGEAIKPYDYPQKATYKLEAQHITIYGKVRTLNCEKNLITSLNISDSGKSLINLDCSSNNLTSLDISWNIDLRELNCSANNLTALDISNNANLRELNCSANNLTALDISNNVNLRELNCSANKLTSLDISNNVNLMYLNCSSNNLTSLDISKNVNLKNLDCSSNKLTSLDVSKNGLNSLDCSSNNLISLDVNTKYSLHTLNRSSNNLTSLYLGKNRYYTHLNIHKNKFDKTNMEKIIESLTDVYYSDYPKLFYGWYDTDETNYKSDELKNLLKDKKYTVFVYNTSTKKWEEWR